MLPLALLPPRLAWRGHPLLVRCFQGVRGVGEGGLLQAPSRTSPTYTGLEMNVWCLLVAVPDRGN